MKAIFDVHCKWLLESFLESNMRALEIVPHQRAWTEVKAGKSTD